MPHCVVCNTRIYGSGHYCTLHKPRYRSSRTQEHQRYISDSAYPGETYFRTSAGTGGTVNTIARRRHHDGHSTALALYNQSYSSIPVANTSLINTLAQTFASLQDTHVIDFMTYDGQQVTVKANLEREQCPTCYVWFANRDKLDQHRWEYPVACEMHGMCMRKEDAVWHATEERHDRCFVRNCSSRYRTEGSWRNVFVEKHVEQCHGHY